MTIRELLESLQGHGVSVNWDEEDAINDAVLHCGMLHMEMQKATNIDADICPSALLSK